jgi:hypothetical protein
MATRNSSSIRYENDNDVANHTQDATTTMVPYSESLPPQSSETTGTTTTHSSVPRPDFERMKKARVRGQIAAGAVGAVGGFMLLGPIGALALGVTGNKVTKAVTKRREKRLKEDYLQQVQLEQESAAPPLPAAVLS